MNPFKDRNYWSSFAEMLLNKGSLIIHIIIVRYNQSHSNYDEANVYKY